MSKQIRLDEVSIFGNKLRFLIPHEWIEVQEGDDYYLYQEPKTDSGWLRVSLFSATTPDPPTKLRELLSEGPNVTIDEETGNWVQASEKASVEGGERIHIYFWTVARVVGPELVRRALFSYTILADRVRNRTTKRTVQLVGSLVSRAVFA